MTEKKTKPELSRIIDLDSVREHRVVNLDIRASSDECEALAKRLNILGVQDLNAHVKVTIGARKDLFRVEGDILAHLTQECSVTFNPVQETVNESFNETMTTTTDFVAAKKAEAEDIDSDEKPVEMIENDQIDLGEVVAQWLTLSLNPYPRSDAPFFEHVETTAEEAQGSKHTPFQVLKGLK